MSYVISVTNKAKPQVEGKYGLYKMGLYSVWSRVGTLPVQSYLKARPTLMKSGNIFSNSLKK